jgi:hypothetical protein
VQVHTLAGHRVRLRAALATLLDGQVTACTTPAVWNLCWALVGGMQFVGGDQLQVLGPCGQCSALAAPSVVGQCWRHSLHLLCTGFTPPAPCCGWLVGMIGWLLSGGVHGCCQWSERLQFRGNLVLVQGHTWHHRLHVLRTSHRLWRIAVVPLYLYRSRFFPLCIMWRERVPLC